MHPLPYKTEPIIVSADMCDHNGHMNVTYYYKLFDSVYTKMYIDKLGFDQDYLESGFSTFTLEDNVRYLKEFLLEDKINIEYALYAVNHKLVHMIGCLKDANNKPSAFWETILGHIDMKKRKTTNFSLKHYDHLLSLNKDHQKNMFIDINIRLKLNK